VIYFAAFVLGYNKVHIIELIQDGTIITELTKGTEARFTSNF